MRQGRAHDVSAIKKAGTPLRGAFAAPCPTGAGEDSVGNTGNAPRGRFYSYHRTRSEATGTPGEMYGSRDSREGGRDIRPWRGLACAVRGREVSLGSTW